MTTEPVLGIDWGSHTIKWVCLTGKPEQPSLAGTIPAWVALGEDGRPVWGQRAKAIADHSPTRAVRVDELKGSGPTSVALGDKQFPVLSLLSLLYLEIKKCLPRESAARRGVVAVPSQWQLADRAIAQAAAEPVGLQVNLVDASKLIHGVFDFAALSELENALVIDLGARLKVCTICKLGGEAFPMFENCEEQWVDEWTAELVDQAIQSAKQAVRGERPFERVVLLGGGSLVSGVEPIAGRHFPGMPLEIIRDQHCLARAAAEAARQWEPGATSPTLLPAATERQGANLAPPSPPQHSKLPQRSELRVPAPQPQQPELVRVDDNVQFTIFRPKTVQPMKWYDVLAFAHLEDLPDDAAPDELAPKEEVQQRAVRKLGAKIKQYKETTEDSTQAVPREGEITFVPEIDGVEFNPRRVTFNWCENVHQAEFRMRAAQQLDGKIVVGQMSVFLGAILLADITLKIKVDSSHQEADDEPAEPARAKPYRKIFASYSHRDLAIVEQFEHYAHALGDRYIRDWKDLRSGDKWDSRLLEFIAEADVFQLFWSKNSMHSPYVRKEWEYALTLRNKGPAFVRPTYWETPFPESKDDNLPPSELSQLHFTQLAAALDSAKSSLPAAKVVPDENWKTGDPAAEPEEHFGLRDDILVDLSHNTAPADSDIHLSIPANLSESGVNLAEAEPAIEAGDESEFELTLDDLPSDASASGLGNLHDSGISLEKPSEDDDSEFDFGNVVPADEGDEADLSDASEFELTLDDETDGSDVSDDSEFEPLDTDETPVEDDDVAPSAVVYTTSAAMPSSYADDSEEYVSGTAARSPVSSLSERALIIIGVIVTIAMVVFVGTLLFMAR